MLKYSINLIWSDEDDSYIALAPAFPGLSAFGDTQEEAISEALTVIEGFIQVLTENGESIPAPDILEEFSGQTRLRLPKSLHSSLTIEAQRQGVSLNTYIIHLLSQNNIASQIKRDLQKLDDKICQMHNIQKLSLAASVETLITIQDIKFPRWG